jgi:two-component system sensor histidine kinase BaeS
VSIDLAELLTRVVASFPSPRLTVVCEPDGMISPGTITVTDTGEGIPADDLPHVFDRFRRVDPSRTRATGGTGLGLAIVKQIVDAHGGSVAIASVVGEGTTVTVRIPDGRRS